ncbi:MAG: uracil-DNA glycosylase [Bacillota bacterium]|jgi:uracil-DNA glycosylase|nr:uracil-DNA glycosylase [Bacillota bacterium]HHU43300.1 uracil-DNA glycosylase [Clostridiales bacterium]
MVNLGNDWQEMIGKEFEKEYYLKLRTFLKTEYQTQTIYPSMYDIFNALRLTSYSQVKAVILGQDPYHQPNQAHGLCFSVKPNVKIPPSLSNIFKELNEDLGIAVPEHGCLIPWAKQGVLLLNTILTVRAGKPMSHRGQGWEIFTDEVLIQLNKRQKPVIFMLWGSPARKKVNLITNPIHYILEAPHPSPLSAHYGFFGSRHFSKANKILQELGQTSINWDLNS